jgi:hypothetical protein
MPEFETLQFDRTRKELVELEKRITRSDYPHGNKEWGGADIVISSNDPPKSEPSFYPDPRYVVTRFSHELSWLFESLRDIFPYIDYVNKYDFYGRLADTADHYKKQLESKTEENEQDLLLAVLNDAISILNEMEEEGYLIYESESKGYLGIEKTNQYLLDLKRRSRKRRN